MTSEVACDVLDVVRLTEFREHHARWRDWTFSEDENSLHNQFSAMFWADAVFKLINETRRTGNKSLAAFNGALAEFVDGGYVAGQAIAIRRLVDRRDDVISLRRLASDISKHRGVVTREIYVCHDGCPYDFRAAEEFQTRENLKRPSGTTWFGDRRPTLSSLAHAAFDELSETDPADRKREDIITEDVFARIEQCVVESGAKQIIESANKFLLHAADIASRKSIGALEPSLAQIASVHLNLARIGNCLSAQIIGEGPCALGVPTAQFDILKQLDRPFIDVSDYQRLTDWWSQHSDASNRLGYERLKFQTEG